MHAKISPGDFVFQGWSRQGRELFRAQREILRLNGYLLVDMEERMDGDVIHTYKHPQQEKKIRLNLMG